MAVTLDQVAHSCSFVDNTATVSLSFTGDGTPHEYEVTLKVAGTPIHSHTGTLVSGYSFVGVASGTYDAQVVNTDFGLGSSNIVSITFDCSPTTFSISETHVNPTTIGGSNGSIDITGAGAYTPYTYVWDDSPTTEDRTGLPAGSYHVVATSADSQTDDITVVLTDPFACDLTITAVTIGKESFRREGDATITISTTTSNVGPIEYSINSTDWQASNVFTALVQGDYTIYVRQYACTDELAFSITARDPAYWMQYDDLLGNVWKAELLERNFAGTSERLCGSGDPIVIQWNGNGKERYETILGSECTLSFESNTSFKFLPLFTADSRKYRVDIYTGPQAGPLNLYWTGYVLPELYAEPYTQPPYFVSIKATDGLGMLKYVPFTLDGNSVFQWDIVKNIIDTLDLNIPIVSSLDIYEITMLSDIDEEPLMQALVNTAVYVKNGKRLKCQEVLKANLLIYYARIYQDRGTIRITRYDQLRGIYGHRTYSRTGVLLSTGYVDPVIEVVTPPEVDEANPLATDGVIFCNYNAALQIKTAFQEITVRQTYGMETNLITDGEFLPSAFNEAGDDLINWDNTTTNIERREEWPGVFSVALTDNGTPPGRRITSRPVFLYTGGGNSISLIFTYFIKSSVLGADSPIVPYQIKIGTQYWDGTAWTATPTIIEEDPAAVNLTRTVDIGILEIPEDGEFTLSLYAVIPHDFTIEEVQYSNVIGKYLPGGPATPESVVYQATQSIPWTFIADDLEVYHGDTPSPVFVSSITIQETGSSTIVQSTEWKRRTVTEGKALLRILVESIAADYLIPTQQLSGDIRGYYHIGASLLHDINDNRIFVANGATYATKSGIWSAEWLEALEVQPADDPPGALEDDTTVSLPNDELTTPV